MRLHPVIRKELDSTGLPWTLEEGSRHQKLILNGKLVSIVKRSKRHAEVDGRSILNTRAQIRRAVRDM